MTILINERIRISSDGDVGIGAVTPNLAFTEWLEVLKNAETNPALNIALEKLLTLHRLTKNYEEIK